MKKQNKILVCLLLMTVLLMGIGYAALSSVTLTITGTASASESQDNFKVYFTGNVTTSDDEDVEVSGSATSGSTTGTVNFAGLTTSGDTEYVIFEIENGSDGIDASDIQVTLHDTDTNYFNIFAEMCDSTGNTTIPAATKNPVLAGGKTYVKVSASLKANPVDATTTSITVKITAEPDTTV